MSDITSRQPPSGTPARPVLAGVDGEEPVVVTLRSGGEVYEGEASPSQVGGGTATAAAAATLAALAALTPSAVSFALDWVQIGESDEQGLPTVVTVLARAEVAGVTMRYAGAALSPEDVREAAAKAVLDAMNRRLQVMGTPDTVNE